MANDCLNPFHRNNPLTLHELSGFPTWICATKKRGAWLSGACGCVRPAECHSRRAGRDPDQSVRFIKFDKEHNASASDKVCFDERVIFIIKTTKYAHIFCSPQSLSCVLPAVETVGCALPVCTLLLPTLNLFICPQQEVASSKESAAQGTC